MANFLQILQQMAGNLNPSADPLDPTSAVGVNGGIGGGIGVGSVTEPIGAPIVVRGGKQEGAPRPPIQDVPDRPPTNLQYILNDDRVAPHPSEMQEVVPRTGMFGMRGTLRDVLGTLGDAFLAGSGGDAVYRPQRQREREGDAMFGFTQNPLQAIERMAAQNPALARQLSEDYQTQLLRQQTLESQQQARQSQISDREFDNEEKGFDRLARWVQAGMPYDQIVKGASRYGFTSEELGNFGITPDMTPEQRAQFAAGGITNYQQTQIPQRERQLDISQQNADASTTRANRPPAGRAPRAVTNVQSYTGEDGYQYTVRSDGEVVRSPTRVRQSGNARPARAAPPGAAATGFTVKRK